jgi:hypothetical protein
MNNINKVIEAEIRTSVDLTVLKEIDQILGRILKVSEILFLLKSDIYNENY